MVNFYVRENLTFFSLLCTPFLFCVFKKIYSWEAYLRSRVRASQKFSSASTPHLQQHVAAEHYQHQHDIQQHSQANDVFHDQHDNLHHQANKPNNSR